MVDPAPKGNGETEVIIRPVRGDLSVSTPLKLVRPPVEDVPLRSFEAN